MDIQKGETIEDLGLDGLRIIQHEARYRFTSDSVLLSDFAKARYGDTVADLGTGSGIIAILLAGKTRAKRILGIEIQAELADMAKRSVQLNGLEDRVEILHIPMQNADSLVAPHSVDVVVTNPPFEQLGGLRQAKTDIAIARHECEITLKGVVETAARLVKFGGRFFMIHRADRLVEIFAELKTCNLEPKRIRFIADKAGTPQKRVLIEAHDHGKAGLIVEPPLVIFDEDGKHTEELAAIYGTQTYRDTRPRKDGHPSKGGAK